MPRRIAATITIAMTSGALVCACGTLLGYDDLTAREDLPDTRPIDTGAEASAEDTTPVGDTADLPVRPPGRPPGKVEPSGKGRTLWLIVRRQYLSSQAIGSVRGDGGATPTTKDAWREFGFDLDSHCTGPAEAPTGTGQCVPVAGAKPDTLLDGVGCRDNNFGSSLIPLIQSFNAVFENESNDAILKGNNTWLVRIDDLDDGPDDAYAPGALFKSADWRDFDVTRPKFDGSDVYDIAADSLLAGDITKPRANFLKGYVRGNTWVSGDPSAFDVVTPFDYLTTVMPLVGGVLAIQLSGDHKTAGYGTLGGAIPMSKIDKLLGPVAESQGFCPDTPLYKTLLAQVKTYADVVSTAPGLLDTTAECDAMSIGLGMEFAPLQPATTVVPAERWLTPCEDAGK